MCAGDIDATLLEYSGLVKRLVNRRLASLSANVERDDLVQAGMIGLMEAIQRFDKAQGVQFDTFASRRITGAILDELRGGDWMCREDRRSQRRISATVRQLEHRLGRAPMESETAREMGMSLSDYQALASRVHVEHISDHLDAVLDDGGDPAQIFERAHQAAAVASAIETLPPLRRERLEMQLGGMTQTAISRVYGVSLNAVSDMYVETVNQLRAVVDPGPAMPAPPEPHPADDEQWARANIRGWA